MDLSNYEIEIKEATQNIPEDTMTLYAQSEIILDRMIGLKGLSGEPDSLLRIPIETLALTKECVPVLESIGQSVGTTHNLYKLHCKKLFNIVINSSAHWSKLWMMGVRTHSDSVSNKDTNAQINAYQQCMKEMSRLAFTGVDRIEFDNKYKNMVGTNSTQTSPTQTNKGGCMGALVLLFVGLSSFIGFAYWGISTLIA